MPVLLLLRVYCNGISDYLGCQSSKVVVTIIFCGRGSGQGAGLC
jgi:hypothetical protein